MPENRPESPFKVIGISSFELIPNLNADVISAKFCWGFCRGQKDAGAVHAQVDFRIGLLSLSPSVVSNRELSQTRRTDSSTQCLYVSKETISPYFLSRTYQQYSSDHPTVRTVSSNIDSVNITITPDDISVNTGDSMTSRHNGRAFSTRDRDNDDSSSRNCAVSFHGGWWYDSCHQANLNGLYHEGGSGSRGSDAVNWYTWRGLSYSLKETEMKFRPAK